MGGGHAPIVEGAMAGLRARESRRLALFAERVTGPYYSGAEVRALFVFDAAGRWGRSNTTESTQGRYNRGVERADLRRARAPVLELYAVPSSPEAMFPFWAALDSTGRARNKRVVAAVTGIHARLRAQFRGDVPQARVVQIHGARHYLYLAHPGEVEHAMLEFLLRVMPASGPSPRPEQAGGAPAGGPGRWFVRQPRQTAEGELSGGVGVGRKTPSRIRRLSAAASVRSATAGPCHAAPATLDPRSRPSGSPPGGQG